MCLSSWSLAGGPVWEVVGLLGGGVSLEDVGHCVVAGRRGLTLLEVFRLSLHFLSVLCLLLVGVTSCLLLPPHLTHHDGLHALEL